MCNASSLTKELQIFEVTASLTKVSVLKFIVSLSQFPFHPCPCQESWAEKMVRILEQIQAHI